MLRALRAALPAAAIVAATTAADAQTTTSSQQSLALDRFTPAPAGDRMFGVESPFVAGDLTPHVMLLADYAHNPLVLRTVSSNQNLGAIVKNQLFLHLDGGLALWSRLYVNLDVPVAVFQSGDSPMGAATETFASPSKAQFGDLRLGLRVRLWGDYFDPFQIALGGYVWFPTGARGSATGDSFVTDGTVRGRPEVILGGRADRVVWSASLGFDVRGAQQFANVQQSTMFDWGAGLGFLFLDDRSLQIGPELSGSLTLKDVQKRTTNAELLLDVRYRVISPLEIAIGAGPGLSSGIGTPDFRGVLSVAYTPEPSRDRDHDGILDKDDACPDVPGVPDPDPKKNGCPKPADRDGDGILDADDACPDVPGVPDPDPKKNGCPKPADRDHDGIPDADDACPDVPGVPDPDPKKNGCPPDRDGDGIPDAEDACPDVPGVRTDDPKTNGCPLDSDGDGIPDSEDACPHEKGPRDPDPKKNGCPRAVRVTDKEVIILEQVQFDTGKATIKKVSDPLLDEVAGVLKEHPEILKIEVQGHTDSRGSRALNRQLSQARAEAVMKALVARSVAASRLQAKGYGPDVPIGDNKTDEGRQKNRRVQFNILEKKPKAQN
jgi:outer membrane protein OmpA-like peptidoglycan-associated protein